MTRAVRILLLGCIAISFLYLLWHSREPMRFNVGDPWSEANVLTSIKYVKQYGFLETSFTDILDVGALTENSYRYIHYPPLAEITYGAIGKYLGVKDIATYRLFAIGFSGLAMCMLFQYLRRLYDARVGLIATALWSTCLFWMMYADSIHQTPILQASTFLSLWGLVRAIETRRRAHYAALFFGGLACFLTSYDCWIYLPAACLFTIHGKRGNPFRRANRRFVAICAIGCFTGLLLKALFVIGAVGWQEFIADVHFQFLERTTSTFDRQFQSGTETIVRRFTLVFSPLFWVTAVYHVIKAVRARSLVAAVHESAAWMLLVGLLFMRLFSQLAASQMLASEVMLPFYTLGSALLIARLLEHANRFLRGFAIGWLVVTPTWTFAILANHDRSFLEREDVEKVNEYMSEHDHNDFLMSNVMTDGHIQAFFDRHYWVPPDNGSTLESPSAMLESFELTGADYIHAAIFTTPESRFIDKSLWPLAMPRRQWSITGWPHLFRDKAHQLIREYDDRVLRNLDAVGAKRIMTLSNFDLYRVDKAAVLERAAAQVPLTSSIDFGSGNAKRHELLGWGDSELVKPSNVYGARISGYDVCSNAVDPAHGNACKTKLTKRGMFTIGAVRRKAARFMIRVDQTCDVRLKIAYANPGMTKLEVNGFEIVQTSRSTELATMIPQRNVHSGVNTITLSELGGSAVMISTVTIEPSCAP